MEPNDDDIMVNNTSYNYDIDGFWTRVMISTIMMVSVTCACIKSCSFNNYRNYSPRIRRNSINQSLLNNQPNIQRLLDKYILEHESSLSEDLNETCSICIEPFESEETNIVLDCQHRFHSQCIVSWLEKQLICPLCRKTIQLE